MELFQPMLDNVIKATDQPTLPMLMLLLKRQHSEEKANDIMRQYCLQTDDEEIRKKGMEFLYMHGYLKDLKQLIHKNKASMNPSKQQWASVYQKMLDRKWRTASPQLLTQQLETIRTTEPELACLVDFLKISIAVETGNFDQAGHFIQANQKRFDYIRDNVMLNFFNERMNQILFMYYWKRNELIIARKFGFQALNQSKNIRNKISLHINLGLTYLFDTYKQALYHMDEALKLARTHDYKDLEAVVTDQNLPFLGAEFGITDNTTTNDTSELAHMAIAKGEYGYAQRLLKTIPADTPFRLYYWGCAIRDYDVLLKAYSQFIEKKSDYFFSRLPLRAMQKLKHPHHLEKHPVDVCP